MDEIVSAVHHLRTACQMVGAPEPMTLAVPQRVWEGCGRSMAKARGSPYVGVKDVLVLGVRLVPTEGL